MCGVDERDHILLITHNNNQCIINHPPPFQKKNDLGKIKNHQKSHCALRQHFNDQKIMKIIQLLYVFKQCCDLHLIFLYVLPVFFCIFTKVLNHFQIWNFCRWSTSTCILYKVFVLNEQNFDNNTLQYSFIAELHVNLQTPSKCMTNQNTVAVNFTATVSL